MTHEQTYFTPPQLAKRWAPCSPGKVRALIVSGQLAALDMSLTPGKGKPRYRITLDAVLAFEESRKVFKPPKTARRPTLGDVTKYF